MEGHRGCGRALCVQMRHLGVALNEGGAHVGLMGVVFIQVTAQRAEVSPTVFTGLARGLDRSSAFWDISGDISCDAGTQRGRRFELRLGGSRG